MNPWQASSSSRLLELLVLREIIPKAVHSDSVGVRYSSPFPFLIAKYSCQEGAEQGLLG